MSCDKWSEQVRSESRIYAGFGVEPVQVRRRKLIRPRGQTLLLKIKESSVTKKKTKRDKKERT